MKTFTPTLGAEMHWIQPDILDNVQFELHSNNGVFETLEYKRGFFKEAVTVRSSFGNWNLKQVSFFNPDIAILNLGTNVEVATYSRNFWMGGQIEFTTKNKFSWKPLDFWHTEWGFENQQKSILYAIRFGNKERKFSNILKMQAIVEIKEHGYRYNTGELSLLLALGWYLMIKDYEDNAATGAAATIS